MYELWYMKFGGSPALKQMTWSDIVNYTGPHIILSYTFQNILKPHTNYSIGIRSHNLYTPPLIARKLFLRQIAQVLQLFLTFCRAVLWTCSRKYVF